ncbi:MAG: histidine kinase, partial [bacterium]|nr:histidine kinase [bacterium]
NAELERFTYTVSHDLKGPLFTIKGFLGYLEKDALRGDAERLEQDVQSIRGAADKMQRLLEELLELSRIGHQLNPPEEVAFGELAREARDLLAAQIAERGAEVAIAADLPVVTGDRTRLLQTLQNLVGNAVRYMGDQPAPRIEIGIRDDAGERVFTVRDNGIGIDPQHHEKVFGLFERLDAETEGTGIGLAVVKRVVEVHGGRIWVESQGRGHGSTFCFTVPDAAREGDE